MGQVGVLVWSGQAKDCYAEHDFCHVAVHTLFWYYQAYIIGTTFVLKVL